jgi:hypothetical protein
MSLQQRCEELLGLINAGLWLAKNCGLIPQILLLLGIDHHVFVPDGKELRVVLPISIPDQRGNVIFLTTYVVEENRQVRDLSIIDAYNQKAILAKQRMRQAQPWQHHGQPIGVEPP